MYLELDDYPPYSDKQPDIFETNINEDLKYIHGYNVFIPWVLRKLGNFSF